MRWLRPQKKKKKEEPKKQWYVAWVTNEQPEAYVVAGKLHSEGIEAMVHKEAGTNAIGISVGMWGATKVLVEEKDYERAMAILEPEELDELPDSTDDISYYWDDEEDEES